MTLSDPHPIVGKSLDNSYEESDFSEPHAIGCIVGALVGDSCGQYHTFATKELSESEMDYCMTLPGGGPW